MVFGEKTRQKSSKKRPILAPFFWPFHRWQRGIHRWEGEIQRIDGIKTVYPFLHIDHFVTQKIERRLQFFAMSRGGVLEGIDIDWDDSWLLGMTRWPIFIVSF